jgi:hypothetical protein
MNAFRNLRDRLRHVRDEGTPAEQGVVMVTIVLVITVLMMICAFAVDAAIYYLRGIQVQRVADSAALNAVTQMPRFAEADEAARTIARGNGMVDGENGVDIATSTPAENNKRFTIEITDNHVPLFFGKLIRDSWSVTKKSTAEFLGNIPLGSVENAIGTGYLSGPSPADGMSAGYATKGFWLGVSGPCAAKEGGDAISARYDGNSVNAMAADNATNNARAGAYLCDTQTNLGARSESDRVTAMLAARDAKNAATGNPPVFQGLVANKDYNQQGYNYIVNVPCAEVDGSVPPPPCSTTMGNRLVIQIYDPVFNPDSVQSFMHGFDSLPTARPDRYGLTFGGAVGEAEKCYNGSPEGCAGRDFGAGNPTPESVNVITDVRVYPADSTPTKYEDDIPLVAYNPGASVPKTIVTSSTDNYLLDTIDPPTVAANPAKSEVGRVRRFGRCVRLTDGFTATRTVGVNREFMHTGWSSSLGYNTPLAAPGGWTAEPETWASDGDTNGECATSAGKWVTIADVDASNLRGQYRVNVRTVDSVNSFGTNAFAIRAYFSSTGPSGAYYPCNSLGVNPEDEMCPSVSGDSAMSIYASVPAVSSFYLAKLSPPSLYRNKIVIVNLWDPGEGADKVEILRPATVATPDCALDPSVSGYCTQNFDWQITEPGITKYSSTEPLERNGPAALDVCASMPPTNGTSVSVSGDEDLRSYTPPVSGCEEFPYQVWSSRNYRGLASAGDTFGKFNGRMVAIAVQVPASYGCAAGTGSGGVTCTELTPEQLDAQLQGGWWKIKYTPQTETVAGVTRYKPITDRTTWRVGLRGDGVRIINR